MWRYIKAVEYGLTWFSENSVQVLTLICSSIKSELNASESNFMFELKFIVGHKSI